VLCLPSAQTKGGDAFVCLPWPKLQMHDPLLGSQGVCVCVRVLGGRIVCACVCMSVCMPCVCYNSPFTDSTELVNS
jgi:hypothetical protein